jgi:methyl-accepting chemotaxis protein
VSAGHFAGTYGISTSSTAKTSKDTPIQEESVVCRTESHMAKNNTGPALSVSSKIFLIAASFSLPIAVLVGLMVSGINSYITFGSLELAGNTYQRSLEQLLQAVQENWLTNSPASAAKVAVGLESVSNAQRLHGTELQFTDEGLRKRGRQNVRPEGLAAKWGEAQGPGGAARQAQLIADVRTMITHAGDTSNLILDPDLDSYYLMDVTLLALPQMQDRIGQVMARGASMLSSKSLTTEQRVALAVDSSNLRDSDLTRIVASSETSLNEDVNFYGTSPTLRTQLTPSLDNLKAASERFIALAEKQSASELTVVTPQEFLAAGQAALQASYGYWDVATAELDILLQTRIQSYQSSRTQSLVWAGLAVIAAALLSFYFMRSITGPLDGLVRSLGPGATLLAASVERIAENSRDPNAEPEEAEIICEELNAHAEKMRAAVLELARHVQGSDADSRMKAAAGELVAR